jgi:hypothetical protein
VKKLYAAFIFFVALTVAAAVWFSPFGGKGAKTYDNNLPAGDIAGLCYPADATVRLDIEGGAAELDVALKSICARVVKTVELDGVTIVYAYSPRVCAEPLPLAEGGYNVMAAYGGGRVAVGAPVLQGSY